MILMKKRAICFNLAAIALSFLLTGCCCLFWHQGCPPRIITQPQSQLIKRGSPVTFSVATSPAVTNFQWEFNGVPIPGATSSSYTIAGVDFINVGAYRVKVWGSPTNTSDAASLSVYSLAGNGGTLSAPLTAFTTESFTCPSGGTFPKGYLPTNPDGTPALFYSPGFTSQVGPFQNPGTFTVLEVNTFDMNNGTTDTGIRMKNNWAPYAFTCNDNAPAGATGATDSKQSQVVINLSSTPPRSYKMSLFYKTTPAPAANIYYNWTYR